MEIPVNENTLRFTRTFEAPRQLVFNCMIDPEHLTHFWGPAGVTTPLETITVDARVGGVFTTVMVNDADGSTYPTSARYLEVSPPGRLSWIEDRSGMTVTITFTELGNHRTRVDIEQTKVPSPMMSADAQAGFLTSLDRFEAYLGELTGADR
ncbi:MAG: SRPBCC domain-containing protein [Pseudarthrobacter sp.]